MVHEQLEFMLPDYARGLLKGRDADLLEEHLESCQSCRENLESITSLLSTLDRAALPRVREGYFQTILPRFRSGLEAGRNRWSDWIPDWTRVIAPAAAAAVLAGFLLSLPLALPDGEHNGLRGVAGEFDSDELAEALLDQMLNANLGSAQPQDVIALAVPQNLVAEQLLVQIAGENGLEDLAPLQTMEDLDNDELELILRRLEQRKLL